VYVGPRVRIRHISARALRCWPLWRLARPDEPPVHRSRHERTLLCCWQHKQHIWCLSAGEIQPARWWHKLERVVHNKLGWKIHSARWSQRGRKM